MEPVEGGNAGREERRQDLMRSRGGGRLSGSAGGNLARSRSRLRDCRLIPFTASYIDACRIARARDATGGAVRSRRIAFRAAVFQSVITSALSVDAPTQEGQDNEPDQDVLFHQVNPPLVKGGSVFIAIETEGVGRSGDACPVD